MKELTKKVLLPLLLLMLSPFAGLCQLKVKVMSYNIRLDVASDGENRWDARKDRVAALMNYYDADFIGGQEVQHHQLEYLQAHLPGYAHIGVGRDDGQEAGEYSCIFYNTKKFDLLQSSTFWLSPTPDSISFGWDAACRRVCTYGLFRSKKTNQMLWVLNTHLDHMGVTARLESARLIIKKIKALVSEKKYPVILTGDFNSKPGDDPVTTVTAYLQNSRTISKQIPYGPEDTWEGFEFTKKPDGCIDYIFVSAGKNLAVKKFATITDSYDMKYPSDHFPVLATLELKKQ